ncbi:MAG: hypothetical protein WA705_11995 [Candidatus Ozemobacteraceae bacterium]
MSNARWCILFVTLILCVFILGIMNRYVRTHRTGRDAGTATFSDWWGLPDRAPEIPQDTALVKVAELTDRKLSPPSDFLFDSPPPEETSRLFKSVSETAKAIRVADESINPASGAQGGLDIK